MKYTFKIVSNPLYDKYGKYIGEYPLGGYFHPEDDDLTNYKVYLTDYSKIRPYEDKRYNMNNYMASFFGGKQDIHTGYIGKWNDNLDNNAHIYFLIDNKDIRKLIITKFDGMSMTNNGMQFIVEQNGNMMDCFPEEGDILFDNIDEAKLYLSELIR